MAQLKTRQRLDTNLGKATCRVQLLKISDCVWLCSRPRGSQKGADGSNAEADGAVESTAREEGQDQIVLHRGVWCVVCGVWCGIKPKRSFVCKHGSARAATAGLRLRGQSELHLQAYVEGRTRMAVITARFVKQRDCLSPSMFLNGDLEALKEYR